MLNEESIQHIKSNAARKEQKIQDILTGQEGQKQDIQQSNIIQEPMVTVPDADSMETASDRKVVICPKCGEEIWL